MFRCSSRTPGITRRPATLKIDDNVRVGGRVYAVVRLRVSHRAQYVLVVILGIGLLTPFLSSLAF